MTEVDVMPTAEEFAELAVYEPRQQVTLFGTTDPTAVIEAATLAAAPLADVIRKQGLIVKIGQGEHVLVDGWTLLGSMLGVFPIVVSTTQLENGWEATVEARTLAGAVVGRGDSMCLRSEQRWARADEYAIRSMAQTRATSRALKGPLGFVMKLAGFESTPAEEMTPEMKPVAPTKDKAAAMRTRIKELSVEADTVRGDTKTADEVTAAVKATWDTTLAKLDQEKLAVLGSDLKGWLEGGCVGEFKVIPF